MGVQVTERQPTTLPPIKEVTLTSEGGTGNSIVVDFSGGVKRNRGMLCFRHVGKAPAGERNLNVSTTTVREFAEALLRLCDSEGE